MQSITRLEINNRVVKESISLSTHRFIDPGVLITFNNVPTDDGPKKIIGRLTGVSIQCHKVIFHYGEVSSA